MKENNSFGVVILSRYNSSRLFGKALMEINGKPVLGYILERVLKVVPAEQILIATSVEKSDDPIECFANQVGIGCYRGSLENVSRRFSEAAHARKWEYTVRINGDNIFLDVNLLKTMIGKIGNGINFISNVKGRTYPKGMSIEIVRMSYYDSLLPEIESSDKYREHVTLYLYDHEDLSHLYIFNSSHPELAGIQLALDTMEDFERSRKIISYFKGSHGENNMEEIFQILNQLNE